MRHETRDLVGDVPFLEALSQMLCQCSALGARTGRALQDCLHAERERSICFAIGEGPSGGARQWIAFALPEGTHPRRLYTNGFTIALPLARAQQSCSARPVRAPKAGECFAQGKALPKTRRPQARDGKELRESLDLSRPKAKRSLVKGTREAPPFHKPVGVKESIEKLPFRKPLPCRRQGKG